MQATLLLAGLGAKLVGFCFMQGENDATDATAAAAYQTNLQSYEAIVTYTGFPDLPVVIGRITTGDAGETESATVRAAQAAFVAANPGVATLIDTDSFGSAHNHSSTPPGRCRWGRRFMMPSSHRSAKNCATGEHFLPHNTGEAMGEANPIGAKH